jgi:hypothetical protein
MMERKHLLLLIPAATLGCNAVYEGVNHILASPTPTSQPVVTETATAHYTATPEVEIISPTPVLGAEPTASFTPTNTLSPAQQTEVYIVNQTSTPIEQTKVSNIQTVVADKDTQKANWERLNNDNKNTVAQVYTTDSACSGNILKIEPIKQENGSLDNKYVVFYKTASHCFFTDGRPNYLPGEQMSLLTIKDTEEPKGRRVMTYIGAEMFGEQSDLGWKHAIVAFVADEISIDGLKEFGLENLKALKFPYASECFAAGFPSVGDHQPAAIDKLDNIRFIQEGNVLEGVSLIGNSGISGGPVLCRINDDVFDIGELQYEYNLDPLPAGVSALTETDLDLVTNSVNKLRQKAQDSLNAY